MQAMILAAGLGTRLHPYSLQRPKPLFPVADVPLLSRIVSQLGLAGASSIRVNAHHLPEQIAAALADQSGISLQIENSILGTGGGLRLALESLAEKPILAVNGDIFHTIGLDDVYAEHCRVQGIGATMVLHDSPRFNNVEVDESGRILRFLSAHEAVAPGCKRLAFTGIQVVEPEVLRLMPIGKMYSIIDCYRDYIQAGGVVRAMIRRNHFWWDIGTVMDYLDLHGVILKGVDPILASDPFLAAPRQHLIGKEVRLGDKVSLHDWVVLGKGAVVGDRVQLTRVVVWDGARIAPGLKLHDCIVT